MGLAPGLPGHLAARARRAVPAAATGRDAAVPGRAAGPGRRPAAVAEAVRGYPGRLLTGLALVAIAAPFLGRLSDRVGRRPLLVAGTLALLVVTLSPFLAALLVRRTGNPVTPAFYAVAVAVAVVVAALLTRETAFRPLDTD
jgi:MFS family permease